MKRYIILAIILLTTGYSFAQNSLNPNVLNGYNFSSTFIDKDYLNNNFLRGWNFGNSDTFTYKLDNALHINTYHLTKKIEKQIKKDFVIKQNPSNDLLIVVE